MPRLWKGNFRQSFFISRIQIENLILEHQPSMVLVEHDQMFLQRVATHMLDVGATEEGG